MNKNTEGEEELFISYVAASCKHSVGHLEGDGTAIHQSSFEAVRRHDSFYAQGLRHELRIRQGQTRAEPSEKRVVRLG